MARRQESPEAGPVLTLLTREGCGLCEEMREIVETVAPEFASRLEIRDVDADRELSRSYSSEVPVLFINGRKAFKYRVTMRQLRRRLLRESRTRRRGLARLLR